MTLADWLTKTKTRGYVFARRIGVTASMISDYRKGVRPGSEVMEKIVFETNGEVTANDFLSPEAQRVIETAGGVPCA